jgi:uncharacterized membrane protein YgaE (UPF0421/DUF939 family)
MFEAEREAFKAVIKMPRPTVLETLELAALYAAQAVVCVVLLKLLFGHFGWQAEIWALISSILALQPGWSQSVVTSVIRIIATTVGAGVALMVSWIHFQPEFQLIVSLVIVVFVCELLRLDTALRTACVAVIIVLSANVGHVLTSGTQRFLATIIGCLMALLVQLVTDVVWAAVKPKRAMIVPMKS